MPILPRWCFAPWYLGGCAVHAYLGLARGQAYRAFGDTMLLPAGRRLWCRVVMPHIAAFALALAAFELATGLLLLGKGRAVKVGAAGSVLFNLYLAQQGLGIPRQTAVADFLTNRLVNLAFAAAQATLFWGRFDRPLWPSPRRRPAPAGD